MAQYRQPVTHERRNYNSGRFRSLVRVRENCELWGSYRDNLTSHLSHQSSPSNLNPKFCEVSFLHTQQCAFVTLPKRSVCPPTMFVSLYSDLEIAYESPELITRTFSVNMRGINLLKNCQKKVREYILILKVNPYAFLLQ